MAYFQIDTDSCRDRAGGIISETNQKFFVQFVVYATIYWAFVLIVMGFFVAERLRQVRFISHKLEYPIEKLLGVVVV
jgi:membrane protein DedA with SNARE-associated domain